MGMKMRRVEEEQVKKRWWELDEEEMEWRKGVEKEGEDEMLWLQEGIGKEWWE